jgi:heme exporter protein C
MRQIIRAHWWKILGIAFVLYAIIGGLLMEAPRLAILNETIRNLYYHVTMWFAMMILMTVSVVYSVRYLMTFNQDFDQKARIAAGIGIVFGLVGISTGSVWARFTWGAYWVNDPKLNGAAITLLIYLAYVILRNSLDEEQKRARLAAVYNIFAYVLLMVFLMILPRMTDSLHPGNGGNPAFSSYDLDNTMRLVFYPAIIGWTLIGVWMGQIRLRLENIEKQLQDDE